MSRWAGDDGERVDCYAGDAVSLSDRSDDSLLQYYAGIRDQVEADRDSRNAGLAHGFANGAAIRAYAATIEHELVRRRIPFEPIQWLPDRV
jgi:hypothetical protein